MSHLPPHRYQMRLAGDAADIAACQSLRQLCFRPNGVADADQFDPTCQHIMVQASDTGKLVGTARVRIYACAGDVRAGYCAQFYDLGGLAALGQPIAEIGRLCMDPAVQQMDVLRLIWGGLARVVDAAGAGYLIGCSSFPGTTPTPHAAALGLLADRHLFPADLDVFALTVNRLDLMDFIPSDPVAGMRHMPPLLKSYLRLGGGVSRHAVIDLDLQTIHVLTGLPVSQMPVARANLLRGLTARV